MWSSLFVFCRMLAWGKANCVVLFCANCITIGGDGEHEHTVLGVSTWPKRKDEDILFPRYFDLLGRGSRMTD